jgi:hypothetical protein
MPRDRPRDLLNPKARLVPPRRSDPQRADLRHVDAPAPVAPPLAIARPCWPRKPRLLTSRRQVASGHECRSPPRAVTRTTVPDPQEGPEACSRAGRTLGSRPEDEPASRLSAVMLPDLDTEMPLPAPPRSGAVVAMWRTGSLAHGWEREPPHSSGGTGSRLTLAARALVAVAANRRSTGSMAITPPV